MNLIFYPKSIVVIGVSQKPDNLAKNIIANLKQFEYRGELYAVGREKGEVYGVPISDSLDDIPDHLDLAVILTPAAIVPQIIDQCGRKGIQRVVVESGGFSEFSEEGRLLEEEILTLIDQWDMRLVGPNCISVVNLETGLCLPFAPISKELSHRGGASIIAQSGGVSITYMGMLSLTGVGANKVVSIGNKADLDETDYLEYLIKDPNTEMVCLYLESISNGRKLLDLAQSSPKPIIIHKANRSQSSQSIAFSHTAALANDDRIVDAAFKQAGILRAEGFRDLVAIAEGLMLPPVKGKDLVILSRSGGHAVAAADSAERHGFRLPPLPENFVDSVRSFFRADVISLTNPLDLGVIFDFDVYAEIVEYCLNTLSPDAILLINTYSNIEEKGALRLAKRVSEIVERSNLPIAFCVYADAVSPGDMAKEINFPVYDNLETALRGLASSRRWAEWQSPHRKHPGFLATTSFKSGARHENSIVLSPHQAFQLCGDFDIHTAEWQVVSSPDEAVRAAEKIGYPVVLKILSQQVSHKTDIGGVILNLQDPSTLQSEAEALLKRAREIDGPGETPSILVQKMIPNGIELILGGKVDPTFGPVVMFGLGGIHVEVLDDVSFRVAPLSQYDADQMISEIRASKLLDGYRGSGAVDRTTLSKALLSISRMMIENPNIEEIDLNPALASSKGLTVVDARIKIQN